MITPQFTFDEEMNAYVSEAITIEERAMAHIELASPAPVVTLKQEKDGGYANYGQSPKDSDRYEIDITSKDEITVMIATPVEVTKCYIIN